MGLGDKFFIAFIGFIIGMVIKSILNFLFDAIQNRRDTRLRTFRRLNILEDQVKNLMSYKSYQADEISKLRDRLNKIEAWNKPTNYEQGAI